MYNHAPQDYICPLCLAVDGIESGQTMMLQDDIVYRDELVVAAVNSKFMLRNEGHVIVFPVDHYENLYDLPDEVSAQIIKVSKKIALAMKELRSSDGIMIQQNNEPASGQHAFHYHMHVFPRFENDNFHNRSNTVRVATPEERKPYSSALKAYFSK